MFEKLKTAKDYIQLVIFLTPLAYAIFKYCDSFIDVPNKLIALQKEVSLLKESNRKQDSALVIHKQFLAQDYQILINNGLAK